MLHEVGNHPAVLWLMLALLDTHKELRVCIAMSALGWATLWTEKYVLPSIESV